MLFNLAPDLPSVRKYLHNHVLLRLRNGELWRGTLSKWSAVKQKLSLTNAQRNGPELSGLGVASKSFRFDAVADVCVADASAEVLATLSPAQREQAIESAANMALCTREDARIEQHRDKMEMVQQADAAGVSIAELVQQVDENGGDDEEADKKKRRRGGKKKKKKGLGLVAVDPNVSAQGEAVVEAAEANVEAETAEAETAEAAEAETAEAVVDQACAAAAQSKPRARVIVELRPEQPPLWHILPALSTRGHGLVHDYLLEGVGPVIVGPESQGLPSLDASTTRDGESTTYRAIADKVLKEHEDEVETKFEDLGLASPTRGFIESLMGAPSGLDADLARVIRGLEDGSINALIE